MKPVVPNGRAAVMAVYGNPGETRLDPRWRDTNIVAMPLPYTMRLAWDKCTKINRISVHRLVVPDLSAILISIWNTARISVKREVGFDNSTEYYDHLTESYLRKFGLDLYGGAFNYRKKTGGRSLSTHAWGIAIDINPAENGYGDPTPQMPEWVVGIFESYGWVWGGRWRTKDGMHFQRARGI